MHKMRLQVWGYTKSEYLCLYLSTTIDLGRRSASSRLGKMMIHDAIDYIPTAYKKNKKQNKKQKCKSST